jgi:hypothetical protein
MTLVTPDRVDRHRRDGCVVIEGLLDPGELARCGAALDPGVALRSAGGARRSVPGHPHFAVDRAAIRPGEPIRSDVTR